MASTERMAGHQFMATYGLQIPHHSISRRSSYCAAVYFWRGCPIVSVWCSHVDEGEGVASGICTVTRSVHLFLSGHLREVPVRRLWKYRCDA